MKKTKEKYVLSIASSSKKIAKNKDKTKSKISKTHPSLKGKSEGAQASTSKGSKKKNSHSSDTKCFYWHEKGHFKMNFPKYKCDLDEGKVEHKRLKGIFIIELNLNLAITIQN
jgi:hypothetical protein